MKSVDEHLAACLRGIDVLSPIDLQLLDAQGCVLAEDVVARTDLPAFDNSAMDGYAVALHDVASASARNPVILPVVGDVAAGVRLDAGPRARHGRADHDRRTAARRAPTPSSRSSGPTAASPRSRSTAPSRPGGTSAAAATTCSTGDVVLSSGHPSRARARSACSPRSAATGSSPGRSRASSCSRPAASWSSPGTQPAGGQIWDSNCFLITTAAREAGRDRVPHRDRPRRAQAAARRDRGPADPRRPRRHHRRRQRRRLRRGQGGHVAARHRRVRPDRHAAGHAAGLRRHRPRPHPDLHPARQPGERLRLLRGLRAAGHPPAARREDDLPARGAGRVADRLHLAGRQAAVRPRRARRRRTAATSSRRSTARAATGRATSPTPTP